MKPFGKAWAIGVALVVAFAILGQVATGFGDYVFHRLGASRDIVVGALWLIPVAAAYIATRYSPVRKLLAGLSFVLIIPLIGTLTHLLAAALGASVDFEGLSGARVVFGLYLVLGGLAAVIGTILGLILSRSTAPRSK